MKTVRGRTGVVMPILGQGTWRMGENRRRRAEEVAALQLGCDLGMTLIDTAEMYADGGAEEIVADAIEGRRDEVFLVSKVLPQNANRYGTVRAAEKSLKRLRTDRIDLYLLHWRERRPRLEETLEGMQALRDAGKILHFGVSNFDVDDLEEFEALPDGTDDATDQVLYNLSRRQIERTVLPWCAAREIVVMGYSPVEQGRLASGGALDAVARRHGVTPACAAIAWTIRSGRVVAIPKAT